MDHFPQVQCMIKLQKTASQDFVTTETKQEWYEPDVLKKHLKNAQNTSLGTHAKEMITCIAFIAANLIMYKGCIHTGCKIDQPHASLEHSYVS